MVDFSIATGVRKIGDLLTDPLPFDADEKWLTEDMTVLLSNVDVVATLVIDFAYSVSSVVEYTLDGGLNYIAFNQGLALAGGQSRFIDVTTGLLVNFRALTGGTLIRCIVSSVP